MKKIAYVYKTKKGNDIFKIGNDTYVIINRDKTEIGGQGNYAEKVLLKIEEK